MRTLQKATLYKEILAASIILFCFVFWIGWKSWWYVEDDKVSYIPWGVGRIFSPFLMGLIMYVRVGSMLLMYSNFLSFGETNIETNNRDVERTKLFGPPSELCQCPACQIKNDVFIKWLNYIVRQQTKIKRPKSSVDLVLNHSPQSTAWLNSWVVTTFDLFVQRYLCVLCMLVLSLILEL